MAGYAPVSPDLSAYHADEPPPIMPLSAANQSYYPPQQHLSPSYQSPSYGPTLHPPQPHNQFLSPHQPSTFLSPQSVVATKHQIPAQLPLQQPSTYQPLKPRRNASTGSDPDYIPTPTTATLPPQHHEPAKRGRKPKPKPGPTTTTNDFLSSSDPSANSHAPSTSSTNYPPASPPDPDPATLKPYPGQLEGVTVHTKFPVARIKRIMQADEDVGKVAQVTPTAVSKALELFMISLVMKAADKAREKGSRKVSAGHLKAAVVADEQFDFLEAIVGRVVEGAAAGKDEGKSEGEGEEVPKGLGKRKRGGGSVGGAADEGGRGNGRGRGRRKRSEEVDEDF